MSDDIVTRLRVTAERGAGHAGLFLVTEPSIDAISRCIHVVEVSDVDVERAVVQLQVLQDEIKRLRARIIQLEDEAVTVLNTEAKTYAFLKEYLGLQGDKEGEIK